ASLARRRECARLLVVGTYRPEDAASHDSLADLTRELQVHRLWATLPLAELPEEAGAEDLRSRFTTHPFPRALARVIRKRTDGNPLFMVSVLDDLIARDAIAAHGDMWVLKADVTEDALGTPENIRQMLEHRLEQLSPDEQQLLEAASVAGEMFSSR